MLRWINTFTRTNTSALCFIIFSVVFLVYIASPRATSLDSRWSVHTSLSILKEGNTDLDEYREIIEEEDFRALEQIDHHLYTLFPVGVSVLSLPFVAIADLTFEPLVNSLPPLKNIIHARLKAQGRSVEALATIHAYQVIELIIASFFCALVAVVIYLIARYYLSVNLSLVVVFIFAFCTSSWSTSSRALWQHGPSMLMLSITLYLVLSEKKRPGIIQYSSIPLTLAFIIRPTNSISVLFFSLYVLLHHRDLFIRYLCYTLPLAGLFLVYNLSIYNHPLPNYFNPNRIFDLNYFMEALLGNLVSPARGLFVYSPILLLSLLGAVFASRTARLTSITSLVIAIIISHWLIISSFPHWWAGHSYGPRFFADMIPFLIFLLIFFIERFESFPIRKKILSGELCLHSFYLAFSPILKVPIQKPCINGM